MINDSVKSRTCLRLNYCLPTNALQSLVIPVTSPVVAWLHRTTVYAMITIVTKVAISLVHPYLKKVS